MESKKNIVIATWIGGGNYGTSLQSFSLHKKLEDLGFKTSIVIPYIPNHYNIKNLSTRSLCFFGINTEKLKRLLRGDRRTAKQKKLDAFEKKYYNKRIICFPMQMSWLKKHTDAFISGSDQIWNTVHCFDKFYFLDFAGDVKRIAYASSMGINDFPDQHKNSVRELLSKFYKIGVREKTAVKAISTLLNKKEICQVLDPTFLLDSNEWINIARNAKIEIELPKKYIFCYFIGNNPWYEQQVQKVKETIGIDRVIQICLNANNNVIIPDAYQYEEAGPLEFVRLIKEATFVCTDSFHATAISINLEKDFVEFMRFQDNDNFSQNSRIYDLLNHYGLISRIYSEIKDDWSKPILYTNITNQLQTDRKESLEFLVNAIEK